MLCCFTSVCTDVFVVLSVIRACMEVFNCFMILKWFIRDCIIPQMLRAINSVYLLDSGCRVCL